MALLRILCLSSAFYAFDIRNVSLNDSTNQILQKILRNTIDCFAGKTPSADEMETLSLEIEQLCSLENEKESNWYHREEEKRK